MHLFPFTCLWTGPKAPFTAGYHALTSTPAPPTKWPRQRHAAMHLQLANPVVKRPKKKLWSNGCEYLNVTGPQRKGIRGRQRRIGPAMPPGPVHQRLYDNGPASSTSTCYTGDSFTTTAPIARLLNCACRPSAETANILFALSDWSNLPAWKWMCDLFEEN